MGEPHHRYERRTYPQVTGQLFRDVQSSGLFADDKTFVDAEPTTEPAELRQQYSAASSDPEFDLAGFVEKHFELPVERTGNAPGADTMEDHIAQLWEVFLGTRTESAPSSSHIDLPHEYVVAGGRFREPYYWDTYFTCEGLIRAGYTDAVEQMAMNFAHLIETLGFVPNGSRVYYRTRSQPPLFYRILALLAEQYGEESISEFVPALETEYEFWMTGADELSPESPVTERVVRVDDDVVLNRYWDADPRPRPEEYGADRKRAEELPVADRPRFFRETRAACESGWDFSSRWFAEPNSFSTIRTTELVPVDLNALLYDVETRLAEWTGNDAYADAAARRAEAIERYCWNADAGMYADYRWTDGVVEAPTLAGVVPLYTGVASDQRAATVAETLRSEYLEAGGLVTTLTETEEQWDWPHGWAPLQWMAVEGLENYGRTELAREIAARWVSMCRDVYRETGLMAEKYDVVNATFPADDPGDYPVQEGFGWTNGVVVALQDRYDLERVPADAELSV